MDNLETLIIGGNIVTTLLNNIYNDNELYESLSEGKKDNKCNKCNKCDKNNMYYYLFLGFNSLGWLLWLLRLRRDVNKSKQFKKIIKTNGKTGRVPRSSW